MSEGKPIKILSFLVPYAILVCAIYLLAYWSSFGINILEFVGLSDIIKLGVYPLIIGGAGAFIIGFLSGTILPGRSFQGTEEEIIAVNKIRRKTKIIIISMLIVQAVLFYIVSEPSFWQQFGIVVGLILILIVKDIKTLEPYIPNPAVRSAVIALAIFVLPFSYGIGKTNAQKVLNGKSVKVVNTKIFKEFDTEAYKSKGLLEGQAILKFIGSAGDYFFFITLDNLG
jgi:hypothetical protein